MYEETHFEFWMSQNNHKMHNLFLSVIIFHCVKYFYNQPKWQSEGCCIVRKVLRANRRSAAAVLKVSLCVSCDMKLGSKINRGPKEKVYESRWNVVSCFFICVSQNTLKLRRKSLENNDSRRTITGKSLRPAEKPQQLRQKQKMSWWYFPLTNPKNRQRFWRARRLLASWFCRTSDWRRRGERQP